MLLCHVSLPKVSYLTKPLYKACTLCMPLSASVQCFLFWRVRWGVGVAVSIGGVVLSCGGRLGLLGLKMFEYIFVNNNIREQNV